MNVEFVDEAKKDLRDLNKKQLKAIRSKIRELRNNPTDHEDSKLIRIKGREIFRLEIKEERRGSVDHRAIYDIEDGKIRIYGIIYREPGYPEEEIARRF
ncbi:MAG: type II toxin-antitoxin system RelE/ParE family toxin [Candidatus Nanohaloarchaea archaeon]